MDMKLNFNQFIIGNMNGRLDAMARIDLILLVSADSFSRVEGGLTL